MTHTTSSSGENRIISSSSSSSLELDIGVALAFRLNRSVRDVIFEGKSSQNLAMGKRARLTSAELYSAVKPKPHDEPYFPLHNIEVLYNRELFIDTLFCI
jgi:hypothetical protein